MLRGLVVLAHAPRQPDIQEEDLSDAVQEVVKLVPSYCAIIGEKPHYEPTIQFSEGAGSN
jgi:hypothetical protein